MFKCAKYQINGDGVILLGDMRWNVSYILIFYDVVIGLHIYVMIFKIDLFLKVSAF